MTEPDEKTLPGPHPRALFVSIDGIDGVGKSTQIERLSDHLRQAGQQVVQVRDPGGTPLGDRLRQLLLESDCPMHRRSEAMLFMASRCELIESIIKPALAAGKTVISDRYLLANVVYQSVGGDVTAEQLWTLGRLASGGLDPDLTILLDMPAAAAMQRLGRPTDRMESRGLEYLETVRTAFLTQLPHCGSTTQVVNADQNPDEIAAQIRAIVDKFGS